MLSSDLVFLDEMKLVLMQEFPSFWFDITPIQKEFVDIQSH